MHSRDAEDPIRLPAPLAEPVPPGFPVWAVLVPVAGAVLLWQVTGSTTMIWFAALGPLLAVATVLDSHRGRRRVRRRHARERSRARARAESELRRRQRRERAERWRRTPDVDRYLDAPDEIWRSAPERGEVLVVGAGDAPRTALIEGGEGQQEFDELRRAAALLPAAPVVVPLTAGVAVVGPRAAATAVARGLVAQACLALPPDRLRVRGTGEGWLGTLPHADARNGVVLWVGSDDDPVPAEADALIVRVTEGMPPPRCGAVLRLVGADRAQLEYAHETREVRVEALGLVRAEGIASELSRRAVALTGAPGRVAAFDELGRAARSGGLAVAIGADRDALVAVDLVEDGPHAVVVGVTGSGKSELLTTWVAALAERFGPGEVTFLLVDFKGGRTFDALRPLPHVTGVVTDLDDAVAERAIASLSAETRRREQLLADAGARDVVDAVDPPPRLVVVVDEYAALTARHPAFHDLFADLAARGRALGIHLILATQRAAGLRDAVLANAPLRIALRVTDPADSRAVIGCIDAAALSGAREERGAALVRRAGDTGPHAVRVSLCPPAAIARIAESTEALPVPRPWLTELPARIPLDELRVEGRIVLGLADEPELQRQRPVLLDDDAPGLVVVGGPGSGKSGVVATIAAQVAPERRWVVPGDLEAAWDAVASLGSARAGDVVLVDDLDLLLSRYPPDYAAAMVETLERCARSARGRGIRLVVSAQRVASGIGRVTDQLPAHAVLATANRADHLAAGGRAGQHDATMRPGRGRLDGILVQFAACDDDNAADAVDAAASARSVAGPWQPRGPIGFVTPGGDRAERVLSAWSSRGLRVVALEGAAGANADDAIVWGTPEQWIGRGRAYLAADPRRSLVVDAACAAELRLVAGIRDLPPYAEPGAGRAWAVDAVGGMRRIVLPSDAPSTRRRLRGGDRRS